MGQGADLFGVQRDAEAEVQGAFAGQRVVHEIAVLVVIAGEAVGEEALSCLCQYCVAYQALFVQAVTQTTPVVVGADVEATEDVVGTKKLRQVGQVRVGFYQVITGRVRVANEQPVIAFGQLEGRASGRVHGGERNAAVVHRGEDRLHAAIGGDTLDGLNRRHGRSTRVGGLLVDGDVDATDLDAGLILTQLSGEYFRGYCWRAAKPFCTVRATFRLTAPPA